MALHGSVELGAEVRPDQPAEVQALHARGRDRVVRLGERAGGDIERDPGHAHGLGAERRRPLAGAGDGRHLGVGTRPPPLVHQVVDDLDPVAGADEGAHDPRLIAHHAPLEPEARRRGAVEQLANRTHVIEEVRVGHERLAPGLADVRKVIELREPGPLPIGRDPLADDRERGRLVAAPHQRSEAPGQQPIVGVEEGQPVAARQLERPVARRRTRRRSPASRSTTRRRSLGSETVQDRRGAVRGAVVDHHALEVDIALVEDGPDRGLDRGLGVPGRHDHGQARVAAPGVGTLSRIRRSGSADQSPSTPPTARRRLADTASNAAPGCPVASSR